MVEGAIEPMRGDVAIAMRASGRFILLRARTQAEGKAISFSFVISADDKRVQQPFLQ
jgi:hypothetical protein